MHGKACGRHVNDQNKGWEEGVMGRLRGPGTLWRTVREGSVRMEP